MSLLSVGLRRGAALLFALSAAPRNHTVQGFVLPINKRVGGGCCASSSLSMSKRSAASAVAKRVIKGLAVGCIGASFPQSAMAFTSISDNISNVMNARNLIGAGVAAQIVRVARNPPREGVALLMSTSTDEATAELKTGGENKPTKIPLVVLSGFLGAGIVTTLYAVYLSQPCNSDLTLYLLSTSGKTTALKRLLENTDGIKVGTIVNDMAGNSFSYIFVLVGS